MNILDIVNREDSNDGLIILHAEGIFWRAYEKSAFLFVTQVANMRVLRRSYKNLGGRQVLYMGFPMSSADTYLKNLKEVERDEFTVTYQTPQFYDEGEYDEWHESMEDKGDLKTKPSLEDMVKSFDISTSTPLDAFNFILQMKQAIKEKDG